MTISSFRAVLVVVILGVLGDDSQAQTQPMAGHVPAAVSSLTPLGRLAATNQLNLAIGFPLQNQQALTNLLRQIYDPADPNYRHFLTPQEFTQKFGPDEQTYEKVIAFAESKGLAVRHRHSNRMMVSVNGTVENIERAFHVHMLTYRHPVEVRTFYAPDAEPSLNLDVPILHIAGLDNYCLPHPAGHPSNPLELRLHPMPNGGSGAGGTYLGNDFRNAYAPGVSLDGAGQSVGLLELDGYYTNDITNYAHLAGLTNTNTIITNVMLDRFLGSPGSNNGEVALDIELTLSMAPGLSQVLVYEAGPDGSADDILSRMATDNSARQLSSSWTWGSGDDPIADQIFLEFAAQGQTFFNASGDADAYTAGIPFPADNPYITIVGGTTLATAPDKSWFSETVWNMNNGKGSGGGISSQYSIPAWQQGLNLTNNQGSATHRNLPDVAMVASQVWVNYNDGQGSSFVGTSCAAPLWAAFMALVNQQGAAYGQPPVGFMNPAIYAIGQGTSYGIAFHDITTGNNTNGISPDEFFAAAGYDLCTGWGTPNGQPLISALQPPDYLVVSPQSGFAANGLPGGPFNPSIQNLTVSNHGPGSLTWSAGTAAAWLNVSPRNGSLQPNSMAAQVTVSLNPAANSLSNGLYGGDVLFTNQSTGIVHACHYSLRVAPSLVQNGGFESGDFSNWNLIGSTFANYVSSNTPTVSHSGRFTAALGQGFSLGYLSQEIATSPGQAYLLSFWLANPQSGTPNQFLVNWSVNPSTTNTIFNQTNMDSFGWTNFQFILMAAGTNSALQFGFRDDPHFLALDDIALTPIPTPALALTPENTNSAAMSWSAYPGLTYQVQYKGDLTQTHWQNLGPAVTATNTSLLITDPISPATNRFYRVIVSP